VLLLLPQSIDFLMLETLHRSRKQHGYTAINGSNDVVESYTVASHLASTRANALDQAARTYRYIAHFCPEEILQPAVKFANGYIRVERAKQACHFFIRDNRYGYTLAGMLPGIGESQRMFCIVPLPVCYCKYAVF
jgi:hypothetical protein